MVRHDDHRLVAESQAFQLHCRRNHFKGLACTYFVGKQGITAVKNMGNSVDLVRSQRDFGVHTRKADMLTVILTGTNGVIGFIVEFAKHLTAVNIPPYPLHKLLLDKLLSVLGNRRFLLVEHRFLFAVFNDRIEDAYILLI